MADDPSTAVLADKSTGGDLGSGGGHARTMHPAVVQILRVEGYDDRGGSGSNHGISAENPHHSILVDSQGRSIIAAAPINVPPRKKTSSFQITSVTVGSRHSNDGGDDSADDLDESHTEDLSSDVLDVSKTTDYDYSSEDAFSSIKDDVATVCQTPGTAALRPSVGPSSVSLFTTTGSNATTTGSDNVSVTVVESPNVPMSVVQNPDIQWQNRFRVVKIESSEPFKRGRWLCMDFLDPPPPSSAQSEVGDRETVPGGGTGSGNSSTSSVHQGESVVIEPSSIHNVVASSWSVEPHLSVSAGTGIGNVGASIEAYSSMNAGHAVQGELPVYPVSIILQTQQQGNLDFTNTALHMQGRTTSAASPQQRPTQSTGGTAVAPVSVQSIPGVLPGQSATSASASMQPMTPQAPLPKEYSQSTAASLGHIPPQSSVSTSIPVPSQPVSEPRNVGTSLSATVGEYVPNISQVQPTQPIDYGHSGVQPPPLSQPELQASTVPPQVIPQQTPAAVAQVVPSDYIMPVAQSHGYQPPATACDYTHSQAVPPPVQPVAQPLSQSMATTVTQPMEPPTYVTPQQLPPTATTIQAPVATHPTSNLVAQDASAQLTTQDANTTSVASTQQGTIPSTVHQPSTQPVASSTPAASSTVNTAPQDSGTAPVGEEGDPESLRALAAYLGKGPLSRTASAINDPKCQTSSARKYSASGASTVAIDNKIEQAMDLVKSHLMFAVREEVDVLKEKITELMDRINQLEYENSILKANANQETLAKLARPPASSS